MFEIEVGLHRYAKDILLFYIFHEALSKYLKEKVSIVIQISKFPSLNTTGSILVMEHKSDRYKNDEAMRKTDSLKKKCIKSKISDTDMTERMTDRGSVTGVKILDI